MATHKIEWAEWDPAEGIDTPADVFAYIDVLLKEGDTKLLMEGLGEIARSKGMAEIARQTGLNRASLYKSLSAEGDPRLSTFFAVLSSLGIQLHATRAAA
jgi:probable addiction module antidote protein